MPDEVPEKPGPLSPAEREINAEARVIAVARGGHVDHNYGEESFYSAEDLLGLR